MCGPLLITLLLVLCAEIPLVERIGLVEFSTPVFGRPFVISSVDIVETLHGGEGGDVERWLEPHNKLLVFAIDFLFAPYCFTFLTCDTTCLYFIIALISSTCFSVFTHFNKKAITHLNS